MLNEKIGRFYRSIKWNGYFTNAVPTEEQIFKATNDVNRLPVKITQFYKIGDHKAKTRIPFSYISFRGESENVIHF